MSIQNGREQKKWRRQWNGRGDPSSAKNPEAQSLLILKHFQEKWGEQFSGALHFHVQEPAGMAGSNHAEVGDFHQQFWPKVCNVVFPVINVVFKSQEETFLALLYSFHTGETRTI